MKINCFDLETIRDSSKIDYLPEVKPNAGYVDLVKIERDIAKKKQEQIDKMALNPAFARICVFGYHDGLATHSIVLEEDSDEAERELLIKTWKVLKEAEHYVSFNGINFDVPVLLMRSLLNRVKPSVKISTKKYVVTNHTDIRMILGNWDAYAKGNMEFYSKLLLGRSCKGEIDGSQVQEYFDMGLVSDIARYCESDCKTTFDIFDLMSQYYLV